MHTLYYLPGSCSMAVHVVLNELKLPVTLTNVSVEDGQSRPAEFLAINPRGNVPTLVEDGQVIREGAAMMIYLLDKYESPLLPRSGKARATALEWLMFCNATLHPAYGRCFGTMRMFGAKVFDAATKDKLLGLAVEQLNKYWMDVEHQLTGKPYLCGDHVTVADILLTVIANWSPRISSDIQFGPNTKQLFKNIIARPSYQQALAIEHVDYQVAA